MADPVHILIAGGHGQLGQALAQVVGIVAPRRVAMGECGLRRLQVARLGA